MSWHENMVNVIRGVIFKDDVLKDLMLIPDTNKNNIVLFRDKYFTNDVISDEIMAGEGVKVVYYDGEPTDTSSIHFMKHRLYIDIFVKKENAHDYGLDRMLHRGELIGERLIHLLGGKRHSNIKFFSRGIYDQVSKKEGYDRKTVVFMYKKIYN